VQAGTDPSCLADLRTTDPRHDKKRIQDTKGGLLEDSYRWILDNADFQRWRDDEQSRLLWIKGDPGKGKTMLLCGIIDELNSQTDLLPYFLPGHRLAHQ
jgi:DNA replication protein DnaC